MSRGIHHRLNRWYDTLNSKGFIHVWQDQSPTALVQWDEDEEDHQKTGWRLVEKYIKESNIPVTLKPDAVEVPVEADLEPHGIPKLIGVLDLVQGGVILDYKTAGQLPTQRSPPT